MKKFDKFILWFFSLIILIMVGLVVTFIFGLFNSRDFLEYLPERFLNLLTEDRDIAIISIVALAIITILALKGFLFQSKTKKDKIDGILLENNNGKLLISRETLENLVRDISSKIQGTESISSKIYLDDRNEIVVNINAIVYQDAVIKEVTMRMQEQIKTAIKQASDLEVSEVNVNIEKISNKTSPEKRMEEEEEIEKIKEAEEKEKEELEKAAKEKKEKEIQEKKEAKEEKVKKSEAKKEAKKTSKETKGKKDVK